MPANNHFHQPLICEVQLAAPLADVWAALTQPHQLRYWSFDMPDFKPEVGTNFTFWGEKDGTRFLHLCSVLAIEKEKRMQWLWTYEGVAGETVVTFELFPQGQKTLLRLMHEGLENLPQDEQFATDNFEKGWTTLLQDLLPKYLQSGKQ